ncbi:uncharacterized protein LOC135844393 [Planococcus citri]|uniref:uncharacterized protein LOC135844393 n=1 Tax=Planococcus citri TaxID=170843 RepID=UPI0031F7E6E0
MKLFVSRVVLCVLLVNEFVDSENTQNRQEDESLEFQVYISKFAPEFQLKASRMYHERLINCREAEFIRRQKKINETITKLIKETDPDRFICTACSVKDAFQKVWTNHVNLHALNQTKGIKEFSAIVKNPPELAEKQIHCPQPNHEKFIRERYPIWLHYINKNESKFANNLRLKLKEAGWSHEQFAWSGSKVYKHYQLYSHQSQSDAIVTFDDLYAIEKLAKGKIDEIYTYDSEVIIRSDNHMKILKLIMENSPIEPELMDYLEELNDWYISIEDCRIISIVKAVLNNGQIECRIMKKYPDRAVPFFKIGRSRMYNEGCLPFIGSTCG